MPITIDQIEIILAAKRKTYEQAAGQLALLRRQKNAATANLEAAKEDIAVWEQVVVLLGKVSNFAREYTKKHLENVVTAALTAVFGEGYEFKVAISTVGGTASGQSAAKWELVSQYGETRLSTDPESANGGGVVDIISLALRLAMMELMRPKVEGPIILDEPAKMLSRIYQPNLAYFLRQYAAKTGRQIIMITHSEDLAEVADKSYQVSQKNGESEVKLVG